MESINSKQIKESFIKYSNESGFKYYDSDPIVASSDSKLLFNISGGVKYQDELLGIKEAHDERVSSIQECVRTDSMDKIGLSGRHHLYFEMLGHFMFYCCNEICCKEEFISFAYKYLVDVVGLDRNRIYATVHPDDAVSLDIWKKLGNKNLISNDKNTFVSPYADKSSLRTEILWQRDDSNKSLVEIWNLVFTQFDSKNIFENSSYLIAADSGASLERIVTAYENKVNNYDNSMWSDFIGDIECLSKKVSIEQVRRMADFTNTSVKLINEGIIPGNKVQPYMLRKMLRVLFEMCDENQIEIEEILNLYLCYNTIVIDKKNLIKIVLEEKNKYFLAIQNGLKQARKEIIKKGINNIDYTYFKSTCGLPEKYINELIYVNKGVSFVKK